MPVLTRLIQGLGGVSAPSSTGLSTLGRAAAGPPSSARRALRWPVACPSAALAAPLLQRTAAWRPRCSTHGEPGYLAGAGLGSHRHRHSDGPARLGSGARRCSSGGSGGVRRDARCHAAAADGSTAEGGTVRWWRIDLFRTQQLACLACAQACSSERSCSGPFAPSPARRPPPRTNRSLRSRRSSPLAVLLPSRPSLQVHAKWGGGRRRQRTHAERAAQLCRGTRACAPWPARPVLNLAPPSPRAAQPGFGRRRTRRRP